MGIQRFDPSTPSPCIPPDPTVMFDQILSMVPQQRPFRFVDRILEVSPQHIVGDYHYRRDEYFYPAHFPGRPVTPGVVIIETMAQIGLVAFGLYLLVEESSDGAEGDSERPSILFTDAEAEFLTTIEPETRVTVVARRLTWRRHRLRVKAEMYLPDQCMAARAELGGMGVSSK
jgi:3-hydroxyacyl-[acyl-carrier-protein] dehydratase